MARANEYVDRYTKLQCLENGHPFADNITWVGLYVHEQEEPDWRPDVGGMICPYPDCDSRVKAVQGFSETSPVRRD
jgi:hypothetical protein